MRAAYYEAFGGPQNVQIGERPDPLPDPDRLLVRTHAAGMGIWDVGILSLVSRGSLRTPIEAQLPLERAGQAMEHVGMRHTLGRVVLRIGA